jgi:type II secretory pathway component GspD/PulD (secretin)
MKRELLTIALAASALAPIAAQEKTAEKPAQAAMPGLTNQVPLKVQFVLARYKGEQKISSTPYMLGVLSNSQKTSLRVGTQVPVVMTVFGAKSEGGPATIPQQSYSYRDVGTNIDCLAQSAGSGLFTLTVTVEDSSVHLDRSPNAGEQKQVLRDVPTFRSFRASFAMVLRDGQTMQYASATDPVSGEVMRIDVTLTLAK